MKKILIICVNYNSYDALHVFLESIDCAAKEVTQSMEIHVAIADNSSDIQEIEESVYPDIHIERYITKQNLGYLGGARFALSKISKTDYNGYDYIAISNVDVTLDPSFFVQLETINLSNVGWIAPSIISLKENKDRNPKILTRPSKSHLQIARLIYLTPLVYHLYVRLFYKNRPTPKFTEREIYAGHGSFMLFSKQADIRTFIDQFEPFLFCEEHFFAEELRKRSLTIEYHPELVVYDTDHVSTSTIPSYTYCKYNKEAISFIIKKYFV